MKESQYRVCSFNHAGKNSLYQLERLLSSQWCRELNNQANILTRCHFIRQEEGVFCGEWKTVCGMPIGSCKNSLLFPFIPFYSHIHFSCGLFPSLWSWAARIGERAPVCASVAQLGQWPHALRRWWLCTGDPHLTCSAGAPQQSIKMSGLVSSPSLIPNLYRACHGKTDKPLKIQRK